MAWLHQRPRRLAGLMLAVLAVASSAAPDAAGDPDVVARLLPTKTFVDLTNSFGPDSSVWWGFGQAKMSPAVDFAGATQVCQGGSSEARFCVVVPLDASTPGESSNDAPLAARRSLTRTATVAPAGSPPSAIEIFADDAGAYVARSLVNVTAR